MNVVAFVAHGGTFAPSRTRLQVELCLAFLRVEASARVIIEVFIIQSILVGYAILVVVTVMASVIIN